jgi:hypothetical protein
MRFGTRNQQAGPVRRQGCHEAGLARRVEMRLVLDAIHQAGHRRQRGADPAGAMLGGYNGNVHQARGPRQHFAPARQRLAIVDRGRQPGLQVDHQHNAVACAQSGHGGAPPGLLE